MRIERAAQGFTQLKRRPRRHGGLAALRQTLVAFTALAAGMLAARQAAAFCRTTTCPFPAGFVPTDGQCEPADFGALCASMDPPVRDLPVFWKSACVSYDINVNASKQVPYDKAVELFATAFAQWTGTMCTTPAKGRVSIDAKNLGPVECDKVQYSSDQGNQHVIVFYDKDWPYPEDTVNTLGLTTITFDPDTGEIYDADMAINSGPNITLSVGDPVPDGGYDLQSIITHEAGHFLGMAHSPNPNTTMYAQYEVGSTSKRMLSPDDTAGICSIYAADGNRAVDPSVADGGVVPEGACDPTPRHGWQTVCAQPLGCGVDWPATRGGGQGFAGLGLGALAFGAARARLRARPSRM